MKPLLLHSSCVNIREHGILICGRPGTGKSSLALQLMDRGATLIADDQTYVGWEDGQLIASPPPSLKGMLEVRGVGLCTFPFQNQSVLKLCVEISEDGQFERLPDPLFVEYHGIKLPGLRLMKNDALGAMKVELKLGHI